MTSASKDLPFEIILSITSHLVRQTDLYQCALINKRFYAATIPRLWEAPMCYNDVDYLWEAKIFPCIPRRESPDVPWDPGFVTCEKLTQCLLTTRQYQQTNAFRSSPLGHYIRKLDLLDEDSVIKGMLLLSHAPFLEHLRLLGLEIDDDEVDCIWQLCPRLKSIHLFDIPFNLLRGIGKHCRSLSSITLERPSSKYYIDLRYLLDCPLTHIHIINYDRITRFGGVISQFHQLESLIIDRCDLLPDGFFKNLVSAATPCPRLKKLHLYEANLTPETALLVMKSFPCLADITLDYTPKVTEKLLFALASGPSLKTLDLDSNKYDVSSQAIRDFIINCPQLTCLVLGRCPIPHRCFPGLKPNWQFSLDQQCLDEIRLNPGFRTTPQDDIPSPPPRNRSTPRYRIPRRHQTGDSDPANSATYVGPFIQPRDQSDYSDSDDSLIYISPFI
ncbi:hypothetical protein [Absidia glauca]|uniref:F-box domain-containing protein n=1 Tax=Absidia glauca TaxID=4829 RepID=A0A163MCG8_ABSGL|nr:hypothetical protein [Absidia glauca]